MTWLHKILRSEKITQVEMLQKIKQSLQQNSKLSVNEKDENGFSPLFIAKILKQCGQPYDDIINYLQGCGAVYNDKDIEGELHLARDAKLGLVVDIFDVARSLNPELVEMYPQAVKPEHLVFADQLPFHAGVKLRTVKLAEAEKEFSKKWCATYMVPKGLYSVCACDDLSGSSAEGMKVITAHYNKFIFAKMGKFGWGVFASAEGLSKGLMFFYGGVLKRKSEKADIVYSFRVWSSILNSHLTPAQQAANRVDITRGGGEFNAVQDASEVFNYMTMLQHLISEEERNKVKFKVPHMSRTIAVSNINLAFSYCGGRLEQLLIVTKNVNPHHIAGINYGEGYWRSKNIVPAIFDIKGRYISPTFYQNREIHIIVDNSNFILVNNHDLENTSKEQGDCDNYILITDKGKYRVSRKWLIDQDIIPAKPQCVTTVKNIEELELALRTAAAAGDLNTCRYLLEWQQPKININAVNKGEKSSKKTALHQAGSKGHYYLVLYLLMQGASPDLEDAERKKPAHYTQDPEILEAILLYNQSKIEQSQFHQLKNNPSTAASLLSVVGLHPLPVANSSSSAPSDQMKSVNERLQFDP